MHETLRQSRNARLEQAHSTRAGVNAPISPIQPKILPEPANLHIDSVIRDRNRVTFIDEVEHLGMMNAIKV